MKTVRFVVATASLMTVPLMMGQGCPLTGRSSNRTTLTSVEQDAVKSASFTAGALAQAARASQNLVQNGTTSNQPTVGNPLVVGTCPTITLTADPTGREGIPFGALVDFGMGCTPAALPGVTVAGSASGFFSPSARTITLSFNNLTRNTEMLSGGIQVAYTPSAVGIDLVGSFDLNWTTRGATTMASGQADLGYDRTTERVVITSFSGDITGSEGTYTVDFASVTVNLMNTGTLIPHSGTITVSGSNIRDLMIRFNTGSPSTGEVEVSIANGPFFTVNLFQI